MKHLERAARRKPTVALRVVHPERLPSLRAQGTPSVVVVAHLGAERAGRLRSPEPENPG